MPRWAPPTGLSSSSCLRVRGCSQQQACTLQFLFAGTDNIPLALAAQMPAFVARTSSCWHLAGPMATQQSAAGRPGAPPRAAQAWVCLQRAHQTLTPPKHPPECCSIYKVCKCSTAINCVATVRPDKCATAIQSGAKTTVAGKWSAALAQCDFKEGPATEPQ